MRRLVWVAVGAAAGIYVARKVSRTLHAYSPAGLAGRAGGWGGAVRAFANDVRGGMYEREAELREALGLEPAQEQPLTPSEAAQLADHPGRLDLGSAHRPALSAAEAAQVVDHPANPRRSGLPIGPARDLRGRS